MVRLRDHGEEEMNDEVSAGKAAFDRATEHCKNIADNMRKVVSSAQDAAAALARLNNHSKLEAERQRLAETIRDLSSPDAAFAMPNRDRQRELKQASTDYIDVLLEMYDHVVIGFKNGEGYAYLGDNLNDGVAYHMKAAKRPKESKTHSQRRAAMQAYTMLLNKLGKSPKDLPHVWQTT